MFRSSTILWELVQSLAKVTLLLKHSVKLCCLILCGDVAACHEMACVLFVVQTLVCTTNSQSVFWITIFQACQYCLSSCASTGMCGLPYQPILANELPLNRCSMSSTTGRELKKYLKMRTLYKVQLYRTDEYYYGISNQELCIKWQPLYD